MADPALLLGAAVVRTACKIWLRDQAIAASAAVSVVDVIQAKVADVREQRRLRRLFEDLEERVADSVLSSAEVEFRAVPENERHAAVLAVRDTLDRAKLTSRALLAADLAASRLDRAVRPFGRKFTETLSQDATALYDQVLYDCCAYVVEVANVLPGFEVGVFAELLARQTEILRQVEERFDLLPVRTGGADTFEPTYQRLVAKQLDKVELFGVTVSEQVGSYPLSVAYVTLSVRCREESIFAELAERTSDAVGGTGDRAPAHRMTSTDVALGPVRRAFVRGEAGSGKTTLLQWLAVRAGRREFTGPMADWNDCVPMFIRLRRYAGAELPAPEDFLAEVGRNIAHTMPPGWVHHLLATGRALVLVDGVDELPGSQRKRAREWLRELLLTYPDARYVVTSRPTAAAESWLDGEAFDVLEIQPMTVPDIDAFVTHWHAAMAAGATDTETARIGGSGDALMAAIRTHRHLRMLTVNPLMTALVCALHLDRRAQLPNDRMELYSIALEMLLERRDTEREIRTSERTILRADKALIMEDLAYWLVRNGWSDVSTERMLERLAGRLHGMHRVRLSAEEVLTHLLERSGLLRMPVEGRIGFVHKTFQEFLAARAAVAGDDIGALAIHAEDDQWREVVLMAAGHARPNQADSLLRHLLTRAQREPDRRHVLHVLAVAAMQHAPRLAPDVREQLNDIAARLLPPRSMAHAVALAGAGDLILELLSARTDYSTDQARATIRLATLIGGEHALSIIENCARNTDADVQQELERAWPEFEPAEFAARVMAGRTEAIRIEDPKLLAGLKHLGPLHSLDCAFAHGWGELDYLRELPELSFFSVQDPELRDFTATAAHPALRTLHIGRDTPVPDVAPIGRCAPLRSLIMPLPDPAGRARLGAIRQVRMLEFNTVAAPEDVLPHLADGLVLKRFGLRRCRGARDLDDLLAAQQVENLHFLLLDNATELASVAGIGAWANTLTGLLLRARNLTDMAPLAELRRLTFLNLGNTPVRSFEFARELTDLARLHIGGLGELPGLAPLRDLPALRDLYIWGTAKVDLSGLAGATDLNVHVDARARSIGGTGRLAPSVVVRRN